MAHEFESGLFVNTLAWHGHGKVLNAPPTIAEALKLAGLDWTVSLERLGRMTSKGFVKANRWAIVRDRPENPLRECLGAGCGRATPSETCELCGGRGEIEIGGEELGTCGKVWRPLQNQTAFEWFQPIVDAGLCTLEAAGSLRGGARVWILAKIAGQVDTIVNGDVVERYILLAHGHDGVLAIRAGLTAVRVVCNNTLSAAIGDGKELVRIFHHAGAKKTLDEARDIILRANGAFDKAAEVYRALAQVKNVSRAQIREFVDRVFPKPAKKIIERPEFQGVDAQGLVETVRAEQSNAQLVEELLANDREAKSFIFESVMEAIEGGAGNQLPGVEGTAWGAFNGMTDFLTHSRGKDSESRLNNTFFGPEGARALNAAVETFLQ